MLRVVLKLLLAPLAALALTSPAQARLFTQPELDALVAPIALYPDGLVSDVLVAATHPDQVFAAAQLPKDAAADESWDPAVKSLLSFPDVLQRMAESPQWTRDLGEAFVGQEPHVMDTVQSLRRRAQAQGTLKSTDQINVQQEGQAIVVQPRTQVVYVPYYDPYVVYGPWWWPAYQPVYWRPWAPFYASVGFFWSQPAWHAHRVVTVNKVTNVTTNVNVQRNFVNRPASQWQRSGESREFHRAPDSQHRPTWNSAPHENRQAPRSDGRQQVRSEARPQFRGEARSPHTMPAAPRFSESRMQQAPRMADSRPQQAPRMTGNAAPRPSQSAGGHGGGNGGWNGGGRGGFNGGHSGGGGGGHAGGGGGRGGRG